MGRKCRNDKRKAMDQHEAQPQTSFWMEHGAGPLRALSDTPSVLRFSAADCRVGLELICNLQSSIGSQNLSCMYPIYRKLGCLPMTNAARLSQTGRVH